jgi:hypothetical protein
VEILDEFNNLRCQASWLPWRFAREANGKWHLCFNGHPVVRYHVTSNGRIEFCTDHWWSVLIQRFPRQERLLERGAVRQVRPAQLKLSYVSSRRAISLYIFSEALALLRTGRLPFQIERHFADG